MAYGTIKVDTITFTDGGVDKSVSVSGLVENPTFTGNVTATGTISGDILRGQTISGVTVTGTTAQFTSGTFTSLTGVTVTGTTANFTSGNFTNISGGTHTITSGVFASGTAANPSISFVSDPNSGLYSPGADQVAISTNGTGRLFVTSDGKIGVAGTPSNPLDVFGSATLGIRYKSSGSYAGIVADNTSSTGGGYFGCHQNGTQKAVFGLTGAFLGDTSADAGVFAETGQAIRFFTNGSTSEKARITDDGKLGLGTSSVSAKLHIRDGTTEDVSGSIIRLDLAGTNPYWEVQAVNGVNSASRQLRFSHSALGGATPLTITQENRVGIGTTAPLAKLHVNNGTNENIHFTTGGSGDQRISAINDANNATVQLSLQGSPLLFRGSGGSEVGRWDTSGRFLVGTSTTSEVNRAIFQGNSTLSTGTGIVNISLGNSSPGSTDELGRLQFTDSTHISAAQITGQRDSGTWSASSKPTRLVFSTTADGASSPTERMRIDNAGNVGINATPSTSYRLLAKTSSAIESALGTQGVTGDTATQSILVTKFDNDTTTAQNFIQFQVNNGGANCGRITANGANTAAFGSTSDIRLKENIEDLPPQLENILGLRPVEFDYIESEGGGHQIGFIAQEMQQIYPDVVNERGEDDMLMITGWSKTEARLVKALQEAVAKIETLEAKVAALEGA
jgi:hypothetical protein